MKPFWGDIEQPKPIRPRLLSVTQALSLIGGTNKAAGGPGIVVLNQEQDCIFSNPAAERLLNELRSGEYLTRAFDRVPRSMKRCCQDLDTMLKWCANSSTWGRVQLTRVLGEEGKMVLLRLQAIPASAPHAQGYLTLGLMEPYASRAMSWPSPIPSNVQLTMREQTCVTYLAQGMTNKEIALQVGISAHTVKDHLKRVMEKTGASNRAGIIARVLGRVQASPDHRVGGSRRSKMTSLAN